LIAFDLGDSDPQLSTFKTARNFCSLSRMALSKGASEKMSRKSDHGTNGLVALSRDGTSIQAGKLLPSLRQNTSSIAMRALPWYGKREHWHSCIGESPAIRVRMMESKWQFRPRT